MIFPKFQLARDGAMTAASVLDLLARGDEPLDVRLSEIPRYHLLKVKIAVPLDRRDAVLAAATDRLARGAEHVERIDGVKIYRTGGWVLLRPSGTEPLVRIFAEAKDAELAHSFAEEGVRAVRAALGD
ncbi:MAG: phosphoglucosamine mutase, partial [Thermoplasmata archaeon]